MNGQKAADFGQERVLFYYRPNAYQISLAEKALLEKALLERTARDLAKRNEEMERAKEGAVPETDIGKEDGDAETVAWDERENEKSQTGALYGRKQGYEEEVAEDEAAKLPAAGTWKETIWRFAAALILYFGLGIVFENFISSYSFFDILRRLLIIPCLACGTMLVFLIGEIDLSVGSVIAISGCICAGMIERAGVPVLAGVFMGIVCGSLMGLFNGYVISSTGIPSYIVTLATMQLGAGIVSLYTGGVVTYLRINGVVRGVLVLWCLTVVFTLILCSFILKRTDLGRNIYAAGKDKMAAERAGVNTKAVTLLVFTLGGFLASLTGIMMMAAGFSGYIGMGQNVQMDAIAAVILGGTSIKGGKGSVSGTLAGVVFVCILNTGIVFLTVDIFWQYIIQGILILIALYIDFFRSRKPLKIMGR